MLTRWLDIATYQRQQGLYDGRRSQLPGQVPGMIICRGVVAQLPLSFVCRGRQRLMMGRRVRGAAVGSRDHGWIEAWRVLTELWDLVDDSEASIAPEMALNKAD